MKKIRSKMKALECLIKDYISFFFSDAQGAANSEVSNGILPKFELIQAVIVVLVTRKNEDDPKKINELEC